MRHSRSVGPLAGCLVVAMLVEAACAAWPSPEADRLARGRSLFETVGCYGCHTIGAYGTPLGPDLSRAGSRYPPAELLRWLQSPAASRPMRHMPEIELTDEEARSLAEYLATLR